MPTLKIHHSTTFHHGNAATFSWQMLRLHPRHETNQRVLDFDLEVSPEERDVSKRVDYFGNIVHRFTTQAAAEALKITMTSRVLREPAALPPGSGLVSAKRVRGEAEAAVTAGDFGLQQFRVETPAVPFLAGATEIAADLSLELPALEWLERLGQSFSEHYIFDPKATLLSTPLRQVIEKRRGVCQDFSHLLISCLRQLGFPAAYASGYLLTRPPPGQPRLRGVDAMHAWVSVWIPDAGWVDYDPTNECFVSENHIVVARGRDYSDVSPIRGIFRGGARHVQSLDLTVEAEEEAEPLGSETPAVNA